MALAATIKRLIAAQGYVTIAQFMELVLQHPEHGYYRHGDRLGPQGDFITAPEISQMFGEIIGLWIAEAWEKAGRPKSFVLLELGPGRGTMMHDLLRAAVHQKGFLKAAKIYLFEGNQTFRAQQAQKLADYKPHWIDDLAKLPKQPLFVVANEFFDALPIRQFEKTSGGWAERVIAYENGAFCFAMLPPEASNDMLLRAAGDAKIGTVLEANPMAQDILHHLSRHIAKHGGAGLFVDYGYIEAPGRNTFQAQRQHEIISPFDHVGAADLTAHVDFAALRQAVEAGEAKLCGLVGQGMFLHQMGIETRAKQLWIKADNTQRELLEATLHRLVNPSQMGVLFKVLGMAHPDMPHLPGFDPIS
jgi:NADH dehydrogenase [ubiquinone] 1 alpha subcomplex assembly factor 7